MSSDVEFVFTAVGINQVLHEIAVRTDVRMRVIAPLVSDEFRVTANSALDRYSAGTRTSSLRRMEKRFDGGIHTDRPGGTDPSRSVTNRDKRGAGSSKVSWRPPDSFPGSAAKHMPSPSDVGWGQSVCISAGFPSNTSTRSPFGCGRRCREGSSYRRRPG